MGRREVRSDVWVVTCELDLAGEGDRAMIPGSNKRSSWKCTRLATRSLENSFGE